MKLVRCDSIFLVYVFLLALFILKTIIQTILIVFLVSDLHVPPDSKTVAANNKLNLLFLNCCSEIRHDSLDCQDIEGLKNLL